MLAGTALGPALGVLHQLPPRTVATAKRSLACLPCTSVASSRCWASQNSQRKGVSPAQRQLSTWQATLYHGTSTAEGNAAGPVQHTKEQMQPADGPAALALQQGQVRRMCLLSQTLVVDLEGTGLAGTCIFSTPSGSWVFVVSRSALLHAAAKRRFAVCRRRSGAPAAAGCNTGCAFFGS